MDPPAYFIGLSIAACIYVLYKVTERSVLDNIPGPSSTSFLLGESRKSPYLYRSRIVKILTGNLGELMQNQAGLVSVLGYPCVDAMLTVELPDGVFLARDLR